MLQVFKIDVYSLLDPGATLYFVNPLAAMNFDMNYNILDKTFSVSTPVGDSIVAERVYRGCPISSANIVTLTDSVELQML